MTGDAADAGRGGRGDGATSRSGGPAPGFGPWAPLPGAGLDAAVAAYGAFAEALRASLGPGARGAASDDAFAGFAARFFAGAAGAMPPASATGAPSASATGAPPASGAAAAAVPPVVPAIGIAREHLRRAERLQVAVASLAQAQSAQAALLARAGAEAGTSFLTGLDSADLARAGLRATFDRWVDHAEAAWLQLAHSAAWCEAQARTVDAAIELRAAQQAIADDAARLAGLPTLRDVDALHRRIDELTRVAAAPAPRSTRAKRNRPR